MFELIQSAIRFVMATESKKFVIYDAITDRIIITNREFQNDVLICLGEL